MILMVTIFSDHCVQNLKTTSWSWNCPECMLWRKEEERVWGWSGPTQWSLAASNAPSRLFCLETNTTSLSGDIRWGRRKIHGNKGNLWLETSWIWNWCCQLRGAQTAEWRKVGGEGCNGYLRLSPQFPIKIAMEQKSPKSIQKGAQTSESRKVEREMQRRGSDIRLSPWFPISISTNGRRLEYIGSCHIKYCPNSK